MLKTRISNNLAIVGKGDVQESDILGLQNRCWKSGGALLKLLSTQKVRQIGIR